MVLSFWPLDEISGVCDKNAADVLSGVDVVHLRQSFVGSFDIRPWIGVGSNPAVEPKRQGTLILLPDHRAAAG